MVEKVKNKIKTVTPIKKTTPMMTQYLAIKKEYKDCLLFYRMGDFYELFFDDAIQASKALNITLTKRGRHKDEDIPMAGVPFHAADNYLSRLIQAGYRVAIAEQEAAPDTKAKKEGGKNLMGRSVVRVITPGTLTEDNLLTAKAHNYLACLVQIGLELGLAWTDMSTGHFGVQSLDKKLLSGILSALNPKELLIPQSLMDKESLAPFLASFRDIMAPLPTSRFDYKNSHQQLLSFYNLQTLSALGNFSKADITAAGSLLDYLHLTQIDKLPRLEPLRKIENTAFMVIDHATRRNLELTRTLSGEFKGTLLWALDQTITNAGGRLLTSRITAPLTHAQQIKDRLDQVEAFTNLPDLCQNIRTLLKRFPDLERALGRLFVGRCGPRDLASICTALICASKLKVLLLQSKNLDCFKGFTNNIPEQSALIDTLEQALNDDLPLLARDGNFIRKGFAPQLDHMRTMRNDGRGHITRLELKYRKLSKVDTLKIRHNNLLGFFIEISARHASHMEEPFIHRQTMKNVIRYTTTELSELARNLLESGDRILALEQEIFAQLVAKIMAQASQLSQIAQTLAELDWATAGARLALDYDYIRPHLDDTKTFSITKGRHPVVEKTAKTQSPFIPNDCRLEKDERLWLITGPNMAGKSTFLRQNALIAIIAQSGYFVPAQACHIGVIDRLFSRVGAADDLARGQSTFMVEMVETATILNQSTEKSLVILDEIGRGTATFDGLSIAWATIEYLHNKTQCRALFATHYHELTILRHSLASLATYTIDVKEWKDEIVFLHTVKQGVADRSYGIHVAKLAGLPRPVIKRAYAILQQLEQSDMSPTSMTDLPLFQGTPPASSAQTPPPFLETEAQNTALEEAIADISPDELTPKEALEALYQLKKIERDK